MDRLVEFDKIRISKLLEQIQATVIVFFIAFFVGIKVDSHLFRIRAPLAQTSTARLTGEIVTQLSLNVILAYYIGKIAAAVPFVFIFDQKYIRSLKNETARGTGFALTIIFIAVQKNFQARVQELKVRFE